MEITNGDKVNRTPVASMQSRDGRLCLLWSTDIFGRMQFANDLAGPMPPEPNWVTGGTSTQTVGKTSTLSQSAGSESDTETQSGDTQNDLMRAVWEKKIDIWQDDLKSARAIADAIGAHNSKEITS